MSLHNLRARLDRLMVHVPTPTTGRPMTSETAIRACTALVEQMRAEGAAVPDDDEPLSMEAERALIGQALAASRLEFIAAECLPDVVCSKGSIDPLKPCSRPADPMRYQHATDGEQTRPTHSGGPKSGHLYQGRGETRGEDDCS